MDFEPLDPDVYGRVSDAHRFEVVVAAAREVIANLVDVYAVEVVTATDRLPSWPHGGAETIGLVPAQGTRLVFHLTDFPGVVVRFGQSGERAFPSCGCDACDESPTGLIDDLHDLVDTVVSGGFADEGADANRWFLYGPDRSQSRSKRMLADRSEAPGAYGPHEGVPWPRRVNG